MEFKVGDKVIVRKCGGAGQEMIEHTEIVKVTKTQVTVKNGTRFLKNGNKFGESNKTRGWFTFLYPESYFNQRWNRKKHTLYLHQSYIKEEK